METIYTLHRKAQTILVSSRVYFDILKWNPRKSDDVQDLIEDAINEGYHLGLKDAAEIFSKLKGGEK